MTTPALLLLSSDTAAGVGVATGGSFEPTLFFATGITIAVAAAGGGAAAAAATAGSGGALAALVSSKTEAGEIFCN